MNKTGGRKKRIALGVNIDHVATVRQARRGFHPDPAAAAREAVLGGADQITLHLREDRRHIQDRDLPRVRSRVKVPINLEMALDPEVLKIALRFRPEKACLVPERREELTTEGGLDAVRNAKRLKPVIKSLQKKKIKVSLFIAPEIAQVKKAAELGADAIEIHTGRYAEVSGARRRQELKKIAAAARLAKKMGLVVHAGHGLDYENTAPICRIPEIEEVNIGHSIVSRALFSGMRNAVRDLKHAIQSA